MKTPRILFLAYIMITSCYPIETTAIIPGMMEDLAIIDAYEAPYKKCGFFINSRRLATSITRATNPSNGLAAIIKLSEEHYDALNKRNLRLASTKASEMKDIWNGKYGFKEIRVTQSQLQKINQLKLRSIEQIEMSLPKTEKFEIRRSDTLTTKNSEELMAIFDLARHLTNTPLLAQDVSFDFSKVHGAQENAYLVLPQLEKIHNASCKIFDDCSKRHPNQKKQLEALYQIKKDSFNQYLIDFYDFLKSQRMQDYRAVDRGQTSVGHRNTCLFNSIFYDDVAKGNIPSTKLGSLSKANDYLLWIKNIHAPYLRQLADNPIYNPNGISLTLRRLEGNRSLEAHYGIGTVARGCGLAPGLIANCSVLEIGVHSLGANYSIFLKSKTGPGSALLSYFGCGWFSSENFPIICASCSFGHAQGLVHA